MRLVIYADSSDSCSGNPYSVASIVTNQCILTTSPSANQGMIVVCDDVAKSCKMSQYLNAMCQGAANDTKTVVADGSCQADPLLLMAGQPNHLSKPRAGALPVMHTKVSITTDAMAGVSPPAMLAYGSKDCTGEPNMIAVSDHS
jgi:hypothetical protein